MIAEANDPTRSGPPLPATPLENIGLSRNEVETLCAKAARGAGMSWGHAEEAGFATGWLSARGLDGPEALLTHIEKTHGKAWGDVCPVIEKGRWRPSAADPLCPIALGATLNDFCGLDDGRLEDGALTVGPISHPLLVLPFLSHVAARLKRSIAVGWQGGSLRMDGEGAMTGDLTGFAALQEATLDLSTTAESVRPRPQKAMRTCKRETFLRLNDFAMKTTVPPSDKSRTDAGSGTSDND
ncbi:MAG: DUF3726 domain-containing protein [Paracoccaceae bacterium]